MFTILSAVAEAERDRTGERIAETGSAHTRAIPGGRASFGWKVGDDSELVAIPEQQATISQMRTLRAEGLSYRAIAEKIAASGGQISRMGLKKVLDAAAAGRRLIG